MHLSEKKTLPSDSFKTLYAIGLSTSSTRIKNKDIKGAIAQLLGAFNLFNQVSRDDFNRVCKKEVAPLAARIEKLIAQLYECKSPDAKAIYPLHRRWIQYKRYMQEHVVQCFACEFRKNIKNHPYLDRFFRLSLRQEKIEAGSYYMLGEVLNFIEPRSVATLEQAEFWFKYVVEIKPDHIMAPLHLANIRVNKANSDKEKKAIYELYKLAAKNRNMCALIECGYCAEQGFGRTHSYEEAAKFYRAAIDSLEHTFNEIFDTGRAEFSLGVLYGDGRGVDKDAEKAFDLFSKALKKGFYLANHAIASALVKVPGKEKEAFKYFCKFIHCYGKKNPSSEIERRVLTNSYLMILNIYKQLRDKTLIREILLLIDLPQARFVLCEKGIFGKFKEFFSLRDLGGSFFRADDGKTEKSMLDIVESGEILKGDVQKNCARLLEAAKSTQDIKWLVVLLEKMGGMASRLGTKIDIFQYYFYPVSEFFKTMSKKFLLLLSDEKGFAKNSAKFLKGFSGLKINPNGSRFKSGFEVILSATSCKLSLFEGREKSLVSCVYSIAVLGLSPDFLRRFYVPLFEKAIDRLEKDKYNRQSACLLLYSFALASSQFGLFDAKMSLAQDAKPAELVESGRKKKYLSILSRYILFSKAAINKIDVMQIMIACGYFGDAEGLRSLKKLKGAGPQNDYNVTLRTQSSRFQSSVFEHLKKFLELYKSQVKEIKEEEIIAGLPVDIVVVFKGRKIKGKIESKVICIQVDGPTHYLFGRNKKKNLTHVPGPKEALHNRLLLSKVDKVIHVPYYNCPGLTDSPAWYRFFYLKLRRLLGPPKTELKASGVFGQKSTKKHLISLAP